MERIRELLAKLNEITDEELAELRGLLLTESDAIDEADISPESVALLNECVEGLEKVASESATREQAKVDATAAAQAARARIAEITAEPDETVETPEADDPAEEPDPEEASVEEPAPVAAGARVAAMARKKKPAKASPEATRATGRAVLTAAGALRDVDPATPITDRGDLARAMSATLRRLPRGGAPRGDVLLASARWEYPEDRRATGDFAHDEAMLDQFVGPQALVATGGICSPVDVDYAVPTFATADRPVRDGLPAFDAGRGGITFVPPPDIAQLAAATALWTAATDASPGASVKPVLAVTCGNPSTVLVDAVTTRLQFGNMMSRFAPEQVAANTDLAVAAAARFAEINLLNKIAAACIADVTSATLLGATRDLITVLEQVRAGYLYLHRLPDSTMLTAIFPAWLKGMIKTDLARELAHDNSGTFNVLAITDAQCNDLLRAHGVNAIWAIDGQPVNGSVYPKQTFGVQGATGPVNPFPAKVVWYVFAEGQIQFLDGGRLDLGVVRDSTLDATNDYELFVETFENIAFRGFTGGALQMVSSLCANGGTAGTISTAGSCA